MNLIVFLLSIMVLIYQTTHNESNVTKILYDVTNKEFKLYDQSAGKYIKVGTQLKIKGGSFCIELPETADGILYSLSSPDQQWKVTYQKLSLFYESLQPGSYQFKIKERKSGIQSSLELMIIRPVWDSPIFQASIILLSLLFILFYNYRRQKIMIRKLADQQNKSIFQSDLVRKDLAKNFHDELGNRLAGISALVEMANFNLKGEHTQIKKLLQQIDTQAKGLYNDTQDLFWAFDKTSDRLGEWFTYTKDHLEDVFNRNDICFMANNDLSEKDWMQPGTSSKLIAMLRSINAKFKMQEITRVSFHVKSVKNQFIVQLEYELTSEVNDLNLSEIRQLYGQLFSFNYKCINGLQNRFTVRGDLLKTTRTSILNSK